MTTERLYYIGETYPVPVSFYTAAGALADPATVTFITREPYPSSAETTYVYGTDAEVTKTATGLYALAVLCTSGGTWAWRVVGTNVSGTQNAVAEGTFAVETSPIVEVWP